MEGRDCDVGCTDEIPGGLGSLCSMHYLTDDLSCILFLHAGCKLASLFDNTPKGRQRGIYNTRGAPAAAIARSQRSSPL